MLSFSLNSILNKSLSRSNSPKIIFLPSLTLFNNSLSLDTLFNSSLTSFTLSLSTLPAFLKLSVKYSSLRLSKLLTTSISFTLTSFLRILMYSLSFTLLDTYNLFNGCLTLIFFSFLALKLIDINSLNLSVSSKILSSIL